MTGTKLLPLRVRRYSTFGGTSPKSLRSIRPLCSQRLQLAAEHARRDLGAARRTAQQAASDLAIAPRAVLQVPDDAQLVLAADHFLKRRDRAAYAPGPALPSPCQLLHAASLSGRIGATAKVHTINFAHTCRIASSTQMMMHWTNRERHHEALHDQVRIQATARRRPGTRRSADSSRRSTTTRS